MASIRALWWSVLGHFLAVMATLVLALVAAVLRIVSAITASSSFLTKALAAFVRLTDLQARSCAAVRSVSRRIRGRGGMGKTELKRLALSKTDRVLVLGGQSPDLPWHLATSGASVAFVVNDTGRVALFELQRACLLCLSQQQLFAIFARNDIDLLRGAFPQLRGHMSETSESFWANELQSMKNMALFLRSGQRPSLIERLCHWVVARMLCADWFDHIACKDPTMQTADLAVQTGNAPVRIRLLFVAMQAVVNMFGVSQADASKHVRLDADSRPSTPFSDDGSASLACASTFDDVTSTSSTGALSTINTNAKPVSWMMHVLRHHAAFAATTGRYTPSICPSFLNANMYNCLRRAVQRNQVTLIHRPYTKFLKQQAHDGPIALPYSVCVLPQGLSAARTASAAAAMLHDVWMMLDKKGRIAFFQGHGSITVSSPVSGPVAWLHARPLGFRGWWHTSRRDASSQHERMAPRPWTQFTLNNVEQEERSTAIRFFSTAFQPFTLWHTAQRWRSLLRRSLLCPRDISPWASLAASVQLSNHGMVWVCIGEHALDIVGHFPPAVLRRRFRKIFVADSDTDSLAKLQEACRNVGIQDLFEFVPLASLTRLSPAERDLLPKAGTADIVCLSNVLSMPSPSVAMADAQSQPSPPMRRTMVDVALALLAPGGCLAISDAFEESWRFDADPISWKRPGFPVAQLRAVSQLSPLSPIIFEQCRPAAVESMALQRFPAASGTLLRLMGSSHALWVARKPMLA